MGFLSDDEKAEVEEMYDLAFNTYKEEIALYQTPTEVIISTGPNFNFFYGENSPNKEVTYITQSGVFNATVRTINQADNNQLNHSEPDAPFLTTEAKLKLRMEIGALPYFEGLEKIVLDGVNWRIFTAPQRRGVFERRYFNVCQLNPKQRQEKSLSFL